MGFKWSLVSIPDHLGVQTVGGRLGAASGPQAFWEYFSRMKGHRPNQAPLSSLMVGHQNLTDLRAEVSENHENAAKLVETLAKKSSHTIVVGGGHDHGYSQLLGVRRSLPGNARIGCINIDAHLDVRKPNPKPSSGSPFYLALESGVLDPQRFIEFGIQSQCNAPDLWDYIESKRVEVINFDSCRHGRAVTNFKQSLEKLVGESDAIVVSLDLDSAAEAYAPGVSAPQAEGFNSSELVEFCEVAGACAKVVSLGIFELNPLHDVGGRTARLAATCAFRFLECARNLEERKSKSNAE